MHKKKGQSILEYVIVLTVIVAAIAVAANGVIRSGVSTAFNRTNVTLDNATTQLPGN